MRILTNIFAYYIPIKEIRIFGSRAKGSNSINSDLDLVVFGNNSNLIGSIQENIRQSNFLLKVDLICYEDITDNQILKSEIDIFGKEFWLRDESKINQQLLKQSQKDIFWDKSIVILL